MAKLLSRSFNVVNDFLLLLGRDGKDDVETLVDEAGYVADDPFLVLDDSRLLIYHFFLFCFFLLQKVVLLHHVHLLLFEDLHHLL